MSPRKHTRPAQIATLLLLGLQATLVIAGCFLKEKHFNWVPYDELSNYEIKTIIADTLLSEKAIQQRYRRPARHRENRSIYNLISLIRRYETTYGSEDHAIVILNYRVNGHSSYYWSWPEDKVRATNTASTQR